jgi:hypothetical protein
VHDEHIGVGRLQRKNRGEDEIGAEVHAVLSR